MGRIVDAIEKAIKRYPKIEHITGAVFDRNKNKHLNAFECSACAIGLAIIGEKGLSYMHKLERQDADKYEAFRAIFPEFGSQYQEVYGDNDCNYQKNEFGTSVSSKRTGYVLADTPKVIEKLKEHGF